MDPLILQRKTEKILSTTPWEPTGTPEERKALAQSLLELAAAAPYHYESAAKYRTELSSSLPFRYYIMDAEKCRATAQQAQALGVDAGKMGEMLNTATLLFMVTWLPDVFGEVDPEREPLPFVGNIRNMEHVAAASASIQNVLLGATARGLPNYWSSGGVLRFSPLRDYLKIPAAEVLLGGIFVFPEGSAARAEAVALGKLREKGKELEAFSQWLE